MTPANDVPAAGHGAGVDLISWTPDPLGRRYPLCRNRDRRTRRPSGARGSSWLAPDGLRKSWLVSLNPPPRRIGNWVVQAECDEGRRADGLSSAEREEIRRLRCENRRLSEERARLATGEEAPRRVQ